MQSLGSVGGSYSTVDHADKLTVMATLGSVL